MLLPGVRSPEGSQTWTSTHTKLIKGLKAPLRDRKLWVTQQLLLHLYMPFTSDSVKAHIRVVEDNRVILESQRMELEEVAIDTCSPKQGSEAIRQTPSPLKLTRTASKIFQVQKIIGHPLYYPGGMQSRQVVTHLNPSTGGSPAATESRTSLWK